MNYNPGDKIQVDNDEFVIRYIYQTGNGQFYRIKAETGEVLLLPVEGDFLVKDPTPVEEYEKYGLYHSSTNTIRTLVEPPAGRSTFIDWINHQGLGEIASTTQITWRHRLDGGVYMVFVNKVPGILATATADVDGTLTTVDWYDFA